MYISRDERVWVGLASARAVASKPHANTLTKRQCRRCRGWTTVCSVATDAWSKARPLAQWRDSADEHAWGLASSAQNLRRVAGRVLVECAQRIKEGTIINTIPALASCWHALEIAVVTQSGQEIKDASDGIDQVSLCVQEIAAIRRRIRENGSIVLYIDDGGHDNQQVRPRIRIIQRPTTARQTRIRQPPRDTPAKSGN